MDYIIDAFAVFHGSLIVEGGSRIGLPHATYKGVVLTSSLTAMPGIMVPGSNRILDGFRLVAPLPDRDAVHSDLGLAFGSTVLKGVDFHRSSPELPNYLAMLEEFTRRTSTGGCALEIGSRARSGNTYRHLVHPETRYVGMDITDGPNVDIVGDAHHLSRHAPGPFDFILSISVFEHLLMPWMAAIEMNKVLRRGGLAYIQSHACYPQHDEPWDFWRYSKDAWKGIFNAHTGFKVLRCGHAMPCFIAERYITGGVTQNGDLMPSYLLSACLVEKIGPARVSWDAEASQVADLSYSHA